MKKLVIGMVHLKALPTAPLSEYNLDDIFRYAKEDLNALEQGGATHAIVENFFDIPYSTDVNTETIVAYTSIFTRLKEISKIPLGVNIHSTSSDLEMIIASLCGAEFIRAESFVEARHTAGGFLTPMAAKLTRTRTRLNSNVQIFADINVKESYAFSPQSFEEAINDALKSFADAIILTGLETGNAPSASDAKLFKQLTKDKLLLVGSGVNKDNISDLLKYADGVIVGSSIKKNKIIEDIVDQEKVKELIESI